MLPQSEAILLPPQKSVQYPPGWKPPLEALYDFLLLLRTQSGLRRVRKDRRMGSREAAKRHCLHIWRNAVRSADHREILHWAASFVVAVPLAVVVSFAWAREGFDAGALFGYVAQRVARSYVGALSCREFTEKVFSTFPQILDPWTEYIPPGEFPDFEEETEGRFGGIGIAFRLREGRVVVERVLPGAPAHRAGLVPGEELVSAEGVDLAGRSVREIRRLIRGRPGTVVHLVVRGTDARTRRVELTRDVIHQVSVWRVALLSVEPRIGYVKVEGFQHNTASELKEALCVLAAAPLAGLVIDLRGNPGGLYDEAVRVADLFLAEGVIVSTRGREDSEAKLQRACPGDEGRYGLIALLVNHRTASAAELVAAALRQNKLAVLVGGKTYGKWSVQSVFEVFGNGRRWGALKLTTRRYFDPLGLSYDGKGLRADVPAKVSEETWEKLVGQWTEELWDHWDAPRRLRAGVLQTTGDRALEAARSVVSDPERWRKLVAAELRPQ